MYDGTYNNINAKPKRRVSLIEEERSLQDLLDRPDTPEESSIIYGFIEELKYLLECSSAIEVIEGIHALEAQLNKLQDRFPGIEVPRLTDFYQDLSPLLLQKYWEQRKNTLSEEGTDQLFLKSIFIAIEEEVYIWQEKIN